jgi:hypothetical protein
VSVCATCSPVLPSTLTIRGVLRGTFNSIFMYGVSVSTSPLIYHMQSSVSKPLRCWNHGKQRLARGTHGIREGQSSVHNSRNHRRTAPYSFLQVIQPLYKTQLTLYYIRNHGSSYLFPIVPLLYAGPSTDRQSVGRLSKVSSRRVLESDDDLHCHMRLE